MSSKEREDAYYNRRIDNMYAKTKRKNFDYATDYELQRLRESFLRASDDTMRLMRQIEACGA